MRKLYLRQKSQNYQPSENHTFHTFFRNTSPEKDVMLRHYRNKHGITSLKRRDAYPPPPPLPPPPQQQPYTFTPEQQQQPPPPQQQQQP